MTADTKTPKTVNPLTSARRSVKFGTSLILAGLLSLAGPAMVAQADTGSRGGASSTASGCWSARNQGIWIAQSQGYTVTYAGRCVYLNSTGMWHFTLRITTAKIAR